MATNKETMRCGCGCEMYRWHRQAPWLCFHCGPYEPALFVSPDLPAIMRGLADADAGRTKPLEQIRRELRERKGKTAS